MEALSKERTLAAPSTPALQDTFLTHLCDNNIDVTMFLVNGIKLVGRIKRFDNFTVMLVRGSGTQIVFKHAISAIYPAEPVELIAPAPREDRATKAVELPGVALQPVWSGRIKPPQPSNGASPT